MRLDGVREGDIVLMEIRGERIYGKVADLDGHVARGSIAVHPLRSARGMKVVKARGVVEHWRKRKARAV